MAPTPDRLQFLNSQLARARSQDGPPQVPRGTVSGEEQLGDNLPEDLLWLEEPLPPLVERAWWTKWASCRWIGSASVAAAVVMIGMAAAGMWRGPTADDVKAGEALFTHQWAPHDAWAAEGGDGLGPVFNARSCAECHFQGGTGGGGALKHNVAAIEVLPTIGHPYPLNGVIHAFALDENLRESRESVRERFPIIPKGMTITVCSQPLRKDYDPLRHHSINSPTLFGSGVIDRISDATLRMQRAAQTVAGVRREIRGDFSNPISGRLRVLPDGRIGKFGWKAQFATLEEFVAQACAVELGLSTPTRKQHVPKHHVEDLQARPDLDERQFHQLVAFVAALPAPREVLPADQSERALALRGKEVFVSIGCADCHTPNVGSAEGVYSDFCLHEITDRQTTGYIEEPDVPVPEEYPLGAEWKTPPLWGVAQTAPYLHDGSAPTLEAAIEAHAGQARGVRAKYRKLPPVDRLAVIRFLETLTME
uniref:C-type cytochrome n=1 Tax=Schlesneria paludicola TaxID=360056 RepID=A0A7C4LMP0_9PLAN